jgi:hypothetical protein
MNLSRAEAIKEAKNGFLNPAYFKIRRKFDLSGYKGYERLGVRPFQFKGTTKALDEVDLQYMAILWRQVLDTNRRMYYMVTHGSTFKDLIEEEISPVWEILYQSVLSINDKFYVYKAKETESDVIFYFIGIDLAENYRQNNVNRIIP